MTSPARLASDHAKASPSRTDGLTEAWRSPRKIWYLVTAVVAATVIVGPVRHVLAPEFVEFLLARDFLMYRDATARFMSGGPFYLPEQLIGPYELVHGHVLYPPFSILLFAPFTVLPAFLWWLVPIGATVVIVAKLRPAPWTWPLMIIAAGIPFTTIKVLTGNPVLWVMAAVALSRLLPWASVFVALKPSLFPFALLGVRDRSWWLALGLLAIVSLALAPLLPSWLEFVQVVRDARDPAGVLYSLLEAPMLLIPVLASMGRRDRGGSASSRETGRSIVESGAG